MYRMLRVMNRHDRAVALIVALASVAAPSDASAQQAPPTDAVVALVRAGVRATARQSRSARFR